MEQPANGKREIVKVCEMVGILAFSKSVGCILVMVVLDLEKALLNHAMLFFMKLVSTFLIIKIPLVRRQCRILSRSIILGKVQELISQAKKWVVFLRLNEKRNILRTFQLKQHELVVIMQIWL